MTAPVRSRPRIFAGLAEICGYYASLGDGFAELGVPFSLITIYPDPFQYGRADNNWVAQIAEHAHSKRVSTPREDLAEKIFWRILDPVARFALLIWAILKFDVFIFSYGTSFFDQKEFRFLKLLGKRIICVFHGSDERPHYLSGVSAELPYRVDTRWYIEQTRLQKAMLRRVARWADVIVSHPLSSQLQEKRCLALIALGLPQKPVVNTGTTHPSTSAAVRILHAPSRPISKGSTQIREIIQKLKNEGLQIDFLEITGRPHHEVLEAIRECDFVIDEMWSDSPLATFAAEAAAAGRPAVVGGYGWDILRDILGPNMPPSVTCAPEEIESTIRKLVTDDEYRRSCGSQVKAFVSREWTSRRSAERYLRILDDGGDPSWYFDPHSVSYSRGYGMPPEAIGAIVSDMVAAGGVEALQLSDKPQLLESVLALAGRKENA